MPKIIRIDGLSTPKKTSANLFSETITHKQLIKDDGSHIIYDYNANSFSERVFNFVDKMQPIVHKYPRIGNAILFFSEKLINLSQKIGKLR